MPGRAAAAVPTAIGFVLHAVAGAGTFSLNSIAGGQAGWPGRDELGLAWGHQPGVVEDSTETEFFFFFFFFFPRCSRPGPVGGRDVGPWGCFCLQNSCSLG